MRLAILALVTTVVSGCVQRSADRSDAEMAETSPVTRVPITDEQRRAMEDSVNAFMDRRVQLAMEPDSAKWLALYPTSGPIMFVEDGVVITDRDIIARGVSQEVREMALRPDLTINSRRVDVLAPDEAAITIALTAAITNPKTNEPFALNGAFTAVLAQRDGAMRLLQGHQSFQRQ